MKFGMKGQEEMNWVVTLSVIIIVFAIVLFAVYKYYSEQQANINLLPGFGISNQSEREEIEILRYDLSSGEVKKYNGVEWLEFEDDGNGKKAGVFEDKRFYESDFRGDVEEWYYGDYSREDVENRIDLSVNNNPSLVFYNEKSYKNEIPLLDGIIKNISFEGKDGNIISWVSVSFFSKYGYGKGDDKLYGILSFYPDKIYFTYINPLTNKIDEISEFNSNWVEKGAVLSAVEAWRDSILKGGTNPKMIKIIYYDDSGKKGETKTCVEKVDKKYLIVDLNKRVSKDEDCK